MFYLCFIFPARRFIGGNIQRERYVTMASSAVDRRRNRLGHGKSNMLVGLFHNLRLLKRMRKLLYTQSNVWAGTTRTIKQVQVALLLLSICSLVVSCNMLISVAELSQTSSSTAWRIMRRGKLRGALPSRRLFART